MIAANNSVPYSYNVLNPYALSAPIQPVRNANAGGRTLITTVIIIASAILIGMALGLGLGIGAVGAITDGILIPIINSTENVTFSNTTTTTTISTATITTTRVG